MNILITGGGGFLGAHLAEALLAAGHTVTLYDLNFPARLLAGIALETGDIRDDVRLVEVLRAHHIERVVHLAALLTNECEQHPARGVDVNCRGSAVVFESAARLSVPRVIYSSSVAVFNADPTLPWDDARPYGPVSVYGLTKVFVEHLAQHMSTASPHTDYLGLRFGWIYGYGRDRGWRDVQAMIESFARGERRVPYPDYQAPLDWTYVEDAIQAVARVLDSPPPGFPAYNVSGDYRTIQDAVAYLRAQFPDVEAVPYPAELPPVGWQFQSDRIRTEAGFTPGYSLEAGLEHMLTQLRS
jgi:UDP-glucose 4-epimerase